VATVTTLEGTVQLSGTQVELREQPSGAVLAMTRSDGAGHVVFPDVPPGRYTLGAVRAGFVDSVSTAFDVRAGEAANVLLDVQLTFTIPTVDVVAKAPSPTDSIQPVSMSDMLDGTLMESSPLEGDDFQSLLPLLPGVVRGADGRLRVKGGQPTQAALQVSTASLVDPSTGDFDLELPAPSVESVEVLANPFAAEFGRFATSVTQIRTRRGTDEWEVKPGSLMPRFHKGFRGIRGFEPRLSVRGPLQRGRLFLAQDWQYRFVETPVKSLPDEPDVELTSFDSFTRLDAILSARHTVGGALIIFPRNINQATMNTFRPPETTPSLDQQGWSSGLLDRFALSPNVVQGGVKFNVIPGSATLEIDVRRLPGSDEVAFEDTIRGLLGPELAAITDIELVIASDPLVAPYEDPDGLYPVLANAVRAHDPEGTPLPIMAPFGTDAKHLLGLGVPVFGFSPLRQPPEETYLERWHGVDERVSIDGLRWGLPVLYDAVRRFCG